MMPSMDGKLHEKGPRRPLIYVMYKSFLFSKGIFMSYVIQLSIMQLHSWH
jgi:hypothetical protein